MLSSALICVLTRLLKGKRMEGVLKRKMTKVGQCKCDEANYVCSLAIMEVKILLPQGVEDRGLILSDGHIPKAWLSEP